MANLPSNRTKLQSAVSDQSQSITPASGKANREALIEAYDTLDLLNQKVDNLVPVGAVTPAPPYNVYRDAVINGNFDIWQRGTNLSTVGYAADRWFCFLGDGTTGTFSVNRQSFTPGQTDVPNNPKYFLRTQVTVAGSGQTFRLLVQRIENASLFSGQQATLSLYLRSDVARSISFGVQRIYGTGGSPSSTETVGSTNANVTTNWQKLTLTITFPSVSGKIFGTNGDDYLQVFVNLPINTTFTIDLAQVQLNAGDIALPFQPRSFAEELQLCQRYFRTYGDGLEPIAAGLIFNPTTALFALTFEDMRVPPTITFSAASDFVVVQNGGIVSPTALNSNSIKNKGAEISATVSALTQGQGAYIRGNTATPAKIKLDAEL